MKTKIKHIFEKPTEYLGKEVTVCGWVKTLRDSKNFAFIALSDGSCFTPLQIVMDENTENYDEAVKIGVGSAITARGIVVESQGKEQAVEIKATSVTVESAAPSDYPLQKKRHTNEFLRTIAHLRPRTNTFQAVFRVRTEASFAIHNFFRERGFIYVHTPIIATSDAEGAGNMFQVTTLDLAKVPLKDGGVDFTKDFFGKPVFLAPTGQLNVEAYCLAFNDTYTFGPTFRAENSNTTRHAAEFWMMEPEIAFADINDNMDLAEDMMKYLINHLLTTCKTEMEFFDKFVEPGLLAKLEKVVSSKFERISYTDVIEILKNCGEKFETPVQWGIDLQTEHERYIAEKHFDCPVFCINYPKDFKAFYMRRNDDGKTVAAMDLFVPGVGEIIGGSQREERLEMLEQSLRENSLNEEDYWWYLELRKYGGVKHAGYGLGFERFLMYVTGISNIRDVIPYPRTSKNAEF